MTGWNLPPGCTQADIDRAFGDPSEENDLCCHEEYEVDSEGRAHCCVCDHVWYQTAEEVAAEQRRQREYDRYIDRQMRRDYWRSWYAWLFGWRHSPPDDEIPF